MLFDKSVKVAIIDYGMGNVRSVEKAVMHISGFDISITNKESDILAADILIIPGVGAFPDAMNKLNSLGILPALNRAVINHKKPTLGICLGMQLFFDESLEKGSNKGLGWIPGKVVYMEPRGGLRVPHIGWNSLVLKKESFISESIGQDKDFYFVHSFYVDCADCYKVAEFDYGGFMTAAVIKDNIVGMQFHPEKSQKNGLSLLYGFLLWALNRND